MKIPSSHINYSENTLVTAWNALKHLEHPSKQGYTLLASLNAVKYTSNREDRQHKCANNMSNNCRGGVICKKDGQNQNILEKLHVLI